MICDGIKKIHHIGYLVKDISGAVETFKTLGFLQENEIFEDDGRKASFCFLVSGGTRIELVSPHKDSDLYPLLKKYRNSPYHICLEVDDIAKEKEELSMCSPGGGGGRVD